MMYGEAPPVTGRSLSRHARSPDVAHADVPAPVLLDFTSRRLFEVDVRVGVLRKIVVGAQSEFAPRAAEVVPDVAADASVGDQGGHGRGLALKVVQHGCAQVHEALVFGEVEARAHADATDERVEVVLLNLHAVAGREARADHLTVREFGLRLDEGGFAELQVPADFGRHAVGVVVVIARHAVQGKVRTHAAVLCDQVHELSVLGYPGAVNAKAVGLAVSVAFVIGG